VPAGRFQRALDAAQARFAGPPLYGDESFQLSSLVSFVVSLGEDRINFERPMFLSQCSRVAAAGQFPKLRLIPQTNAVEVVACWASRPANAVDLVVSFLPVPVATGTVQTIYSSDGTRDADALVTTFEDATLAGAASLEGSANLSAIVPVAGVLLGPGRMLQIESDAAGTPILGGFIWRELVADR
jgi:hypothetical protein